jgi:hypothetical protein
MSGEAVDQRKLDFLRGYWAGAEYLIANPEQAESTFESALKQATVYDDEESDA